MIPVDDWFPFVAPLLPGCPETLLRLGIREAAIAFCRRTRLFTETACIPVGPCVDRYSIVQGWQDVERVESVRLDDQELMPISRAEALWGAYSPDPGQPRSYYLDGNRQMVLVPTPDAEYMLRVVSSVVPDATADVVEPGLWSAWRNPIAAGARAWVRRNFATWADPEQEAIDTALFESAIDEATHKRAKGFARAPLRTRGVWF